MTIKRKLEEVIEKARKTFPAVVVTGPRQAGKTTMLKTRYGTQFDYQNLEDLDVRRRATVDPRAFLSGIQGPAIIDEIQHVPELLSYIKTKIDDNRKSGQWIITGSQQFELMKSVTESLAGRAMITNLMPLGYEELGNKLQNRELAESVLRGGYPELVINPKVEREWWCSSYLSTYLARDVRDLTQVGDLAQFERFVQMCAVRTGTICNMADLARDVGVSAMTAKRWLSILETSRQVYLLYPYYRNLGKRLIKSPKLYFTDTALATYLMGINDPELLLKSPYWGPAVETYLVVERLKRYLHRGQRPRMYYLRTRDGAEVDLVEEVGEKLILTEIKAAKTIYPEHGRQLGLLRSQLAEVVKDAAVVADVKEEIRLTKEVRIRPWREWAAGL